MIDIAASLAATDRQHAEGCVKITEDLDRYRRLIADVEPDLIIECGTFSGKSAAWLAETAGCTVVTIDTTPYIDPDTLERWAEVNVIDIVGSSVAPDIVARVHRMGAKRPLVILDSDHSAAHVLAEMHAYADLVPVGSYMVVEDTLLRHMPAEERQHYRGDPADAVDAWLADHHDTWAVDTDVEAMHPVTQFPGGWLRRIA